MRNRQLYAFTGASGTGKSSLLNIIKNFFAFETIELSGRPYLPKKGDYVQNASDSNNRRISYGSTVTFAKSLIEAPEKVSLFYSRCAIDKLAYSRALNIGRDLEDVNIKEIQDIVIPYVKVFYLPIEFPLSDSNDIIRGNNEEIRTKTDLEIKRILNELSVPHIVVSGSIEERIEIIKNYL